MRWFKQLLNALAFLEKNCVVHRDLKLDNLLLSSDGTLVVSDFGKAVLLDESFTIPYMHGECNCMCDCACIINSSLQVLMSVVIMLIFLLKS